MATENKNLSQYDKNTIPNAKDFRFGIVVSEWNSDITENLKTGAVKTLLDCGAKEENIISWKVPGSFELVYGCKRMIKTLQLDAIIAKGMTPLSVAQVEHFQQDANIMLLDTRAAHKFAKGFIPGSVNIGLDGNFAMWVGELIDHLDQLIVLIADDEVQV